jgi:hypothetical protein
LICLSADGGGLALLAESVIAKRRHMLGSTLRHLGIEVDDAVNIAEVRITSRVAVLDPLPGFTWPDRRHRL